MEDFDELTIADEISFEEWFEIFKSHCRKNGYTGPIDKYTFEEDYNLGTPPEFCADQWLEEIND